MKIPAKRMSKILNRSESVARQRMKLLGIIVPPEIIIKFKEESRFKKGHRPANKGTNFIAGGRSVETRFKKGDDPHNTKHDGAISIRSDKCGRRYKWIRISKRKWQMLHVHNWIKENGEIPEGYIVIFKNKDSMNCDPENLLLITRAQHAKRNMNRSKAAASLKKTWAAVKAMEDYGILPATIKFRSKRKTTTDAA